VQETSPYNTWHRSPKDVPPATTNSASPSPANGAPQQQLQPQKRPAESHPQPALPPPTTPSGQAVAGPHVAGKPIEAGQIVARIGGEVVLAGELLWDANRILEMNAGKFPPSELENLRRELMRKQLVGRMGLADTKILYGQVRNTAPAEALDKIRENLAEPFEEEILPRLMEFTKTASRAELEAHLRKNGSSIDQQRRAFIEREIAKSWLGEQINRNPEITHADMLAYYQEHIADYTFPDRVRWEELSVRYDRVDGGQAAARQLIAEMGNEVLQHMQGRGGRPWADVAKEKSHGFTAFEGGQHDWTTRGSLKDKQVDEVLFSLPVGALSPILESPDGLSIVRVIERQKAGRTPFADTQAEIRKTLRMSEVDRQIQEYLGKLRRQTKVWTIFTGDTTAAALVPSGDEPARR
jgi:hypothetical protein